MVRREPIELRTVSFIINKKKKTNRKHLLLMRLKVEMKGMGGDSVLEAGSSWIEGGLEPNKHMAPAK